MKSELASIRTDVFLLVGEEDLLFPYKQSIANAHRELKSLREVIVLPNVGHGIETYPEALPLIKARIERLQGAGL